MVVPKTQDKTANTTSAKSIGPNISSGKATKTVYIVHRIDGWAVQRGGDSGYQLYPTRRAAVFGARNAVHKDGSGQIVVYGLDGKILERNTYQLPPIQDPPGRRSVRIANAVSKVTRGRLASEPLPLRG